MVRGRQRNEKKVLLVDPAHAFRAFHCAGTSGGLARAPARGILCACGCDPCGKDGHRNGGLLDSQSVA